LRVRDSSDPCFSFVAARCTSLRTCSVLRPALIDLTSRHDSIIVPCCSPTSRCGLCIASQRESPAFPINVARPICQTCGGESLHKSIPRKGSRCVKVYNTCTSSCIAISTVAACGRIMKLYTYSRLRTGAAQDAGYVYVVSVVRSIEGAFLQTDRTGTLRQVLSLTAAKPHAPLLCTAITAITAITLITGMVHYCPLFIVRCPITPPGRRPDRGRSPSPRR
jgi:hypothetical protein